MRSNGWNSLGVSSGSFFRSRGLGSGERMLLHPLRVDQRSPLLLTGNAHDGRASNTSLPALVRAISTHLASQYLPATSRSPPPTLHMSTPRAAQLSLHRPGGSAAHTHTSRALTVHSHPPRGDSRRVPPARGSIGCPSQYFSKSLVTCAMVLPLVSGSLLKVNHPKKKVRPTKIR